MSRECPDEPFSSHPAPAAPHRPPHHPRHRPLVCGPPPLCLKGAPEGDPVQVLRYFLETEKLDASRILVIGTRRLEHSSLANDSSGPTLRNLPAVPIDDEGQAPPGSLHYAMPHRIKGLEADVLLLVEVANGSASSTPANLYVAESRARH